MTISPDGGLTSHFLLKFKVMMVDVRLLGAVLVVVDSMFAGFFVGGRACSIDFKCFCVEQRGHDKPCFLAFFPNALGSGSRGLISNNIIMTTIQAASNTSTLLHRRGYIYRSERFSHVFGCPMSYSSLPFDKQTCVVRTGRTVGRSKQNQSRDFFFGCWVDARSHQLCGQFPLRMVHTDADWKL